MQEELMQNKNSIDDISIGVAVLRKVRNKKKNSSNKVVIQKCFKF